MAASSCINDVRFTNTYDLDEYFKCILSDNFAVVSSEKVDEEGREEEFIMLALRTSRGMSLGEYSALFGGDFLEKYAERLKKVREYIVINGDFLAIKDEYLFVQNSVIGDILG